MMGPHSVASAGQHSPLSLPLHLGMLPQRTG